MIFTTNRCIAGSYKQRKITKRQTPLIQHQLDHKVIATMVIWPLDDHTYCAHLGLWRKLYDCSLHHFTTSQCISIELPLVANDVYGVIVLVSYLTECHSVYALSPAR